MRLFISNIFKNAFIIYLLLVIFLLSYHTVYASTICNYSNTPYSQEFLDVNKYITKRTVIRKFPTSNSTIIDYCDIGEKVHVITCINNNWYKIRFNNSVGYILGNNLSDDNPIKCKTVNKVMYTLSKVTAYKGPSLTYDKYCSIKQSSKVNVKGVLSNGWTKLKYKNKTCYVLTESLCNNKPIKITSSKNLVNYKDSSAKITIKKEWVENAYCYAAHIEFTDYKRFGTSCANNKYGSTETTTHANKRLNALLTVNGCYSAPYLNYPVARRGKVYNNKNCWVPAVYSYKTGILCSAWETGGNPVIVGKSLKSLVKSKKVTDTFSFGPPILSDGKIISSSDSSRAQRTFIGTNGKSGDIWVVVSDGRKNDGKSSGLTYTQCAKYLQSKGCTFGVPLDGGGSSTMVWKGKVINANKNQRSVVDFVYFK